MRRPLLILFIITILFGYVYTKIQDIDIYEDKSKVTIQGIVKNKTQKTKYTQYEIGEYLVKDYKKNKNIKVGQIISITGEYNLLKDMNYEDFNYGIYIKSTGCKGLISLQNYEIIGDNIIYLGIGKVKNYIEDTFRYLYKNKSDFINSILLGAKENLSEEEKEMFTRSGTSHVIAISGLHTGILSGIVILFIGGINKYYKLFILAIIMLLYSVMVGLSPSIIRSVIFIIILYSSIFLDKKRDGISTLSLIGIFFIVNNPYIIYNISFQLSFLATLSIIYFYGYINDIFNNSLISVTIAANILTLPIIYYNFKGIPILSILSNVVVVPFMGVIIYLSIISIILFNINLILSKLIVYLNKSIIEMIYFVLKKISEVDFAYIEIEHPKYYYVVLYYTIIFIYMIYKELRIMKEQENELQGYYQEC